MSVPSSPLTLPLATASDESSALLSPRPAFYYYVFAKIEPALSLIGAAYALGWPTTYSDASFSFKDVILLGERGGGPRGVLITRGLGSCTFTSREVRLGRKQDRDRRERELNKADLSPWSCCLDLNLGRTVIACMPCG